MIVHVQRQNFFFFVLPFQVDAGFYDNGGLYINVDFKYSNCTNASPYCRFCRRRSWQKQG